jgi:hypothetical protein
MPLAACFVFGLVAPLVTSVLRLALQLTVQIIRAPLMWIRGISNELAIVIYRHGPGFTRVIARPLAVAVIVAVGYAVSTQLQWKGGAPAAPSTLTASTAAPDCSGDIIPLNCPRKR